MFEIGWTEMLVIAVVMIVVVGPKDLPKMLRTFGKTTAKLRAMAGDFQKQFNEALKEAELDDVKKSVDELRGLNPASQIRKSLNPFEQAAQDVRAGLGTLNQPKPAAPISTPPVEDAPASTPVPAEPLKNGAAEMPVSGPTAMPEPPAVAAPPVPAAKPARKPAANKAAPAAKTVAAKVAPVAKPAAAKAASLAKPAAPAKASKPAVKRAPASAKVAAKSAKPKSKAT